jgi:hypothetical protein
MTCVMITIYFMIAIQFSVLTASVNETRGGGVLIALSSTVRSCKRRYYLEYCDECVWIEIPTLDSLTC